MLGGGLFCGMQGWRSNICGGGLEWTEKHWSDEKGG